jgi:hypothetical protein
MKINEITNTPVELMHDEDDLNYIKQHAIISKKEPINDDPFQNLSVENIKVFEAKLNVVITRFNKLLSPTYTEINYKSQELLHIQGVVYITTGYVKWKMSCPKSIIMEFVKVYSGLVSSFIPETIYYKRKGYTGKKLYKTQVHTAALPEHSTQKWLHRVTILLSEVK